jgi:hypothetical protein
VTAHQKLIRDAQKDGHPVPADFSKARVREISYVEAKEIILKAEYLGTMGGTERAFGLFFDGELAGVECFGKTAGTNVINRHLNHAIAELERVQARRKGEVNPAKV